MTENAYSAFIPEIWSQKLNNILEKNVLCFNVLTEIMKVKLKIKVIK